MIEKILQKLYDEYYPDRDIQVLIVNGRVTLAINDTAQASYSIKGTYRYEEVQNLNQFTNGFVQYGLCPGDGPTAIIGLADPNANLKFILDASPYGKMPNTHSMIFNRYSDEDAKQVSNYTVYGLNGLLELADIVKFDKIHFSYDARYQEAVISQEPRVLKMNCKFDRFHYLTENVNTLRHISHTLKLVILLLLQLWQMADTLLYPDLAMTGKMKLLVSEMYGSLTVKSLLFLELIS